MIISILMANNILVQRQQYIGTSLVMPDEWHTTLNQALNHNLDTHLISYPPFIINLSVQYVWKSLFLNSKLFLESMPNLQLRDSDSTTQIPNSRVFIIRWWCMVTWNELWVAKNDKRVVCYFPPVPSISTTTIKKLEFSRIFFFG